MASFDIQPCGRTAPEYDELVALWNALHPDDPRLAEIWADVDAKRPETQPYIRLSARRDGMLIASGACGVEGNTPAGTYLLSLIARPDAGGSGVLGELFDEVLAWLAEEGASVVQTEVRDTRPWETGFFSARDFAVVQRSAINELDVGSFDARPHAQRVVDAASAGYEVVAVADLPEDGSWRRAYHDLDWALLQDVPASGGWSRVSFEDFCTYLDTPRQFTPEATFVARTRDGDLVGTSRIIAIDGIPDRAFTGLTGVRREHRRRGLATAMKLAGIGYAREHGFRVLCTHNDADSSMLRLNHALGFETRYHRLTMERRLA